jgi:hypothetical protein
MLVRKVRGQNKVGKIIIFASEAAMVRRLGIDLEKYVRERLIFIAKERRWKWYFNKEKQ